MVGTTLYKKSMKPTTNKNIFLETLIKWRIELIKEDYPADYKNIKRYDGFWNEPSNLNFQTEIETGKGRPYYNTYKRPVHIPKQGEWKNIEKFLKHIFTKRYELFLDYMHVLYVNPKQKLPAICLLRKEKGTGKSSFLVLMGAILGENSARVNRDTLMSRFNGDWSEKLICTMDEAKFEYAKEMNRLKYLISENEFITEFKGVERTPTPFYGKFFFASNHETDFIRVDSDDDRFWVERVNLLLVEDKDRLLVEKMKNEIPAFLFDIIQRRVHVKKESRLFFPRDMYITNAFQLLVSSSRSNIETQLVTAILTIMDDDGCESFCATPKDLENLLGRTSKSILLDIRNILKTVWKLSPSTNSNLYKRIQRLSNGEIYRTVTKGRYYEFQKSFFQKRFDDLMI